MLQFDASQQRVFELDPARHARVLGAPGTGKTSVLIESFARVSELPGWGEGQVLAMAPSRLAGSKLRSAIEHRLNRAMGGTPVRTAVSLAFELLQRQAALQGDAAPRLLTGTVQDEVTMQVLEEIASGQLSISRRLPFAPEVLRSEAFRGELRELSRVIDDFALEPQQLVSRLSDGYAPRGESAFAGVEQWPAALELASVVRARLGEQRAGELTSSAIMRSACAAVRNNEQIVVPRLVLVDDAGELGEGALALLSALAERGTRVWVFGDPDNATSAFQGERARVLAGLRSEFERRGVATHYGEGPEQAIVLDYVHRHGGPIRDLVSELTQRTGTAGAGQQRSADAAYEAASQPGEVQFAIVGSASEQLGTIAHRLRARHLGLGNADPLRWGQMAVICRTRSQAKQVAKQIAAHQVPSGVAAGGVVLREHQLVRELIRLLQHALGLAPITASEVSGILGGSLGGLDPIALRRLRGALRLEEMRSATAEERSPLTVDELLLDAFEFPGEQPVIDTRSARKLMRLGRLSAAAQAIHQAGGTPREVLWQLWDGSGLARELQDQALDARGARSDEAHRSLDAVMGLFFALQRHEEQDSDRSIDTLLDDLLLSAVPEDSLAARSERDSVTVTTPQGVIGRQFELVCVVGLQDGVWPNLRSRGSLLGVTALERWLRGEHASVPSRRDTMHDELRLFTHAVSRARREVLVIAVSNEDEHPSPFFTLGRKYRLEEPLPSSRLTLRGAVAEMRRRIVSDPSDVEALEGLVALARAGVPGAHPGEWYGVAPPSTETPLSDIEGDPDATVAVSPSQMEKAEKCPLDWIASRLGAGASDYRANLGTLLHHALETVHHGADAAEILRTVQQEWGSLHFEAGWQEQRAEAEAEAMAVALAEYLGRFERSERRLLGTEADFVVPIDFARLRGSADRLEAETRENGEIEITVVDLKTGRSKPSAAELEHHAQLQAYQLGVLRGAFLDEEGQAIRGESVGAKLVYVHPDALGKTQQGRGEKYTEITQAGLDETRQQVFEQRVLEVARVMAAARFTAQVEHHCENPNVPGKSCALHIIPAVSHA